MMKEFERDHLPSSIMHSERLSPLIPARQIGKHHDLLFLVALLSGARTKNHRQLAKQVLSRMKTLFHGQDNLLTSASVLLANVYGSVGESDRASSIHQELTRSGMKKKMGMTWTWVDGEMSVSSPLVAHISNTCILNLF